MAGTLLLALLAVTPAFSQTPNKMVEWSKFPVGGGSERAAADIQLSKQIDGIEIEDVLVAGKSITIGEPFVADVDWIKNITFRVKNVSNEQLMAIQIGITLPEVSKSPYVVFASGCGHDNNQKCILPGDEVELRIPPGRFYDWVKDSVAKERDISVITRATIREMFVTLPNGTHWLSGCVKTASPKNACPNPLP